MLIPLFIFVLSLVVYLLTLSPSLPPQGDAGELITVAYTLGIAHPPGYPLYTMLAHLFIKLLPFGSVAWRVNLLSALLHSFTLAIFYFVVRELFQSGLKAKLKKANSTVATITLASRIVNQFRDNVALAAFTASLILAFSYTFWLYSLVAEVFALNNFLTVFLIFSALKFKKSAGRRSTFSSTLGSTPGVAKGFPWLYLCIFIFFLGLANHHTIVLILPAVLYLLWPEIKLLAVLMRQNLKVARLFTFHFSLFTFLGLSPYLYLLWVSSQFPPPPVGWSFPKDLPALMRIFLRADYGTFTPLANYDVSLVALSQKADQLTNYFKFAFDDFTPWGMALAALGFLYGLKKHFKMAIFALLGFLISGFFFLTYASFPFHEGATALNVVERFYLLPHLFLIIFIFLALIFLLSLLNMGNYLKWLKIPLLAFFVFEVFLFNFSLVDQSQNFNALNLGRNLLISAEKNALIILQGDIPTFAAFYLRYVKNFRQDIDFLTPNFYQPDNNFSYLKAKRPDLNFDFPLSEGHLGFIKANIDRVPLYSFSVPQFSFGDYEASPSGLLFRFYPQDKLKSQDQWRKEAEENFSKLLVPQKKELKNFKTIADYAVLSQYLNLFMIYSQIYYHLGDLERSLDYLHRTLSLEPFSTATILRIGEISQESRLCQKAKEAYEKVLDLNPRAVFVYDKLVALAKECYQDEAKVKEFEDLRSRQKGVPLKDL